ncbi:hypothetical protein TNCV_3361081 [Trichonephila clavipes]|nr:hypothetical protein TNCV_3361081 [Trichonephila clavipes]
MELNNDLPTDIVYLNATLSNSGNSSPERLTGPTCCARLEVTKADIRDYTVIVQEFENMIMILRQSNAQNEHDPTFVDIIKQRFTYEDLLEKVVSEFGSLLYCDTPGCPVHGIPTSFSVKSQPTKRKYEDGFSSPLPGKVSKHNINYK